MSEELEELRRRVEALEAKVRAFETRFGSARVEIGPIPRRDLTAGATMPPSVLAAMVDTGVDATMRGAIADLAGRRGGGDG
jgi:hypothetical protein